MRSAALQKRRSASVDDDDESSDRPLSPRPWWWRLLLRRPRDTLAFLVAVAAAATIVVNASYLQHGRHPAPIFAVKPLPIAAERPDIVGVLPPARPHELARPHGVSTDARPHGVSTEARPRPPLAIAAPRKDPIADLLAAHSAPPSPPAPVPAATPTRALAQPVSAPPAPAQPAPQSVPQPPAATVAQPTRSSAHPTRQVLAVQRALSEYGYGQIKPTGVYDADTRLAIQHFERDRKLPITGEMSERMTRELANLTGRDLN